MTGTQVTAATGGHARLAALFGDPRGDVAAGAVALAASLSRSRPATAAALACFADALAALAAGEREELWLGTFVVAPSCVPYVGVHIHGEESFKRGELLARLRDGFAAHGFAPPVAELPDHVAVLLEFAGRVGGEELDELERYLLAGPLEAMAGALARTANPYRFLIEAARRLLGAGEVPEEIRELMSGQRGGTVDEACRGCAAPAKGR